MKKFYIQHHFTTIFIMALIATFITFLYYTEIVPAEANPVLTATPVPVNLTAVATPTIIPGDTTGIVIWGVIIVIIIFTGMGIASRNWFKLK